MVDCPFPFFEGFSGNRWVSLSKRFIAMQSGSAILFCVPRKLHHHLLTTVPDPRWQFIKKLHQGIISKTSLRVRRIRKSPFKRLQTVNRPLGFEFYSSGHARFRQMISVTNDHPLHWIVHVSLGHEECSFQVHKGEAFVGRTWRRWNQCFRSIVKGCRTDLLGIGHSRCGACEWTSWYRKAIAGNTLDEMRQSIAALFGQYFEKKTIARYGQMYHDSAGFFFQFAQSVPCRSHKLIFHNGLKVIFSLVNSKWSFFFYIAYYSFVAATEKNVGC